MQGFIIFAQLCCKAQVWCCKYRHFGTSNTLKLHNIDQRLFPFFPSSATRCDMCWACAPKPRCHGSYMTAFSCYKTRSSSKGGLLGFYLCLAYFEALDPLSCLPFGAHCVMEEVTERAASLAALPPPIHSS